MDFERFHPGSETVTLADNYRSTPEILTAANAVLAAGGARMLRLKANRPSGARPTIRAFDDETAEAQGVVRACRDHHHPAAAWNQQAVLVRTNAQAAVLTEAFGAAGIPHRVRGTGSLLEQPEIKQCLAELRRANSLGDFLADCERAAHLEAPEALGRPSDIRDGGPGSLPEMGDDSAGSPTLTDERRANVAELVRLGREYQALDPTGGSQQFGQWLRSILRDTDGSGDAVEIVTFHAAKGLEWSIVHVAGMEKGYVPIHHAGEDPEAIEEETTPAVRRAHACARRAALQPRSESHVREQVGSTLPVTLARRPSSGTG